MSEPKHIISVVDVWQSQSYWPINGWGAPNKQLGSTPHFWIPSMQIPTDSLPETVPPPSDWTWSGQWAVDKSNAFGPHDAEGWYYGPNFEKLAELIQKRSGAEASLKTSMVRRRRWVRTMHCSSKEVLEQIRLRVEKINLSKAHIEAAISEKQNSLQSIMFYEENRAFVFDQSLSLATQGTTATLAVLKDLFFKLKRLHEFISERAQVEQDYALKIESLGYKYSNSITQHAVNPLNTNSNNKQPATPGQQASKTPVTSPAPPVSPMPATNNSSANGAGASAQTPSTLRSSITAAGGMLGYAGVSGLNVVYSAAKTVPAAGAAVVDYTVSTVVGSPGPSDPVDDIRLSADATNDALGDDDMDYQSHGARQRQESLAENEQALPDQEDTYLNRDASAVLFNSLAAVHITAAERMKQFSKTMKSAGMRELESVLTQLAKLLKAAKLTFRKNSDICQHLDTTARDCYTTALMVLEQALSASAVEVMHLRDEAAGLQGDVPKMSTYNTAAMSYVNPYSDAPNARASSHGSSFSLSASAHGRRNSFISSTAPPVPRARHDSWLVIQRYRQVVRDSQEAMSVLIAEYMDLELHQQILCNKVYSLFVSLGNTYYTEQTSLWEESLQVFGSMLGDTMSKIEGMGRPNPILQSPFAKLLAAEEAYASNPSTPVRERPASVTTSASKQQLKSPGEIAYEDFASGVGVFSFTVLYKDPLPLCPAVCLSGDFLIARGKDFSSAKGDVLMCAIWKSVYGVISSDGYLHLLARQKCDMPDVSYCLKRCAIQSFADAHNHEEYTKIVLCIKPTHNTETTMKNGAQKGDDLYLRFNDEESLFKWHSALLDPNTVPPYVDERIEHSTRQAMLRSMAIIRGETDKIELSLNKYTNNGHGHSHGGGGGNGGKGGAIGAAPIAVPPKVQETPTSTYDAFKHRSFIYDDADDENNENNDSSKHSKDASFTTEQDSSIHRASTPTTTHNGNNSNNSNSTGNVADQDAELDFVPQAVPEEEEDEEAAPYDPDQDQDQGDGEGEGEEEYADSASGGSPHPSDASSNLTSQHSRHHTDTPEKSPFHKKLSRVNRGAIKEVDLSERINAHNASGNALDKDINYKFGSKYQKGGDSWISTTSATTTPLRHTTASNSSSRVKQLIPTSDQKQPLARRHSSMINQYETGLQEEKRKVDGRVLDSKRRTIQDVVTKVILEGDDSAIATIDPALLLEQPGKALNKSNNVKQMAVKFSSSNLHSSSVSSTSVDVNESGGVSVEGDLTPTDA